MYVCVCVSVCVSVCVCVCVMGWKCQARMAHSAFVALSADPPLFSPYHASMLQAHHHALNPIVLHNIPWLRALSMARPGRTATLLYWDII